MRDHDYARLVSLACHDLRTPLATVNGFAKTLSRGGELAEREARFVGLIDAAAEQMAELLDLLGLASRIQAGRYEPVLQQVDTLSLARSESAPASGTGATIETDAVTVSRSLEALAVAAARHGSVERTEWRVEGRALRLVPVTDEAAPVLTGEEPKDLGALVARMAIERLGGSLRLDDGALAVLL